VAVLLGLVLLFYRMGEKDYLKHRNCKNYLTNQKNPDTI